MRINVSTALSSSVMVMIAGCSGGDESPLDPAEVSSTEQAVVGGVTDTGDPEVFELFIQGNNGMGAGCTATLIDRRTLLTAAHCVDPRELSATSIQIFAINKTSESQVTSQADYMQVVETRFHPNWNPGGSLAYDIGLALLANPPPGVTPKPWNTQSLDALTGKPIRVVGYGSNVGGANGGTGAGVKRKANLTFRQMYQDVFMLGNGSNIGICHGDSGGPSFYTFPDGVERVVGVHSFTTGDACLDGADSRVDFFQPFIQTWLSQKEAPSCAEDGRCAANCPSPDIDCVCKADGACTAACPNLSKDPDCPKDCGPNGICSIDACPVPDADCVPQGESCSSENQCVGRLCITDAQHSQKFCSRLCTADTDCSTGLICNPITKACTYPQLPEVQPGELCNPLQNVCALNSVCTGQTTSARYCSYRCSTNAQCPTTATCELGYDGLKFCAEPPKPVLYLPAAGLFQGEASSGCASAGGLGGSSLLVALLALRRRPLRRA